MVSITDYAYVLSEKQLVEAISSINSVPINNEQLLMDMINECYNQFPSKPAILYIAHSIPFVKGFHGELFDKMKFPVRWLSGIPCAITHMALKIASAQINSNKFNRVLIIGADKAYSDNERRFFGTIMGDAVIGMMVENKKGLHEVITSHMDTVLIASEGENSDSAQIKKYRDTLPLLLRNAYKDCLSKSGLSYVDFISPHTPNKGIWDVFSKQVKVDRSKILDDNITQTGHLNSNDSFYHYFTHCEDETIEPGKTTMLINPGFGGTRGCTILRRN